MNKVRTTVCGKDFVLQTDETEEYIARLGRKVESEIDKLMKVSSTFTQQNAAILTALIALDEAQKANDSIDNIRTQIKGYVDDAGAARSEKEELAKKVKALEAENAALKKELDELKKKAAFPGDQLVLENTVTPAVTVLASAADKKGKPKHENVSNAPAAAGPSKDSAGERSAEEDGSAPYVYDRTGEDIENYQLPGQISLLDSVPEAEPLSAAEEQAVSEPAEDKIAEAAPDNNPQKPKGGRGRKKKR